MISVATAMVEVRNRLINEPQERLEEVRKVWPDSHEGIGV
jgi:hypothetical protein